MTTPIRATLVTTEHCELCAHARRVLQEIFGNDDLLEIEELDWNGPAGAALIRRDGVPFAPALYVEGELWGYGRLSERALRKKLASHVTTDTQ